MPPHPYLREHMNFFSRFNPLRALRDLRAFLSRRKPTELIFMAASVAITWTVIFAFTVDTDIDTYKEPEIIYVQSWPLNRTDAEIKAQQKKDLPAELARRAELERLQKERQQQFQRVENKLEAWGL